MKQPPLDEVLRSRVDSFVAEIAALARRAATEALEGALGPISAPLRARRSGAARERVFELVPEPRPHVLAPAAPRARPKTGGSPAPLSLDGYERMAIVRGLAENGSNPIAAARAMGMSKSAIYRRMTKLGIPHPHREPVTDCDPCDPLVGTREPLTLSSYVKAAIRRAIDECGGDKVAAARTLGVGKSTLYRLAKRHGVA